MKTIFLIIVFCGLAYGQQADTLKLSNGDPLLLSDGTPILLQGEAEPPPPTGPIIWLSTDGKKLTSQGRRLVFINEE